MSEYNWNRIALTGFAGAGKSEAGKALEPLGYQNVSLGNIGKGDLDAIIQKRFGFSAFTEDRAQKKLIRNTLEWYMLDAFEFLLTEFFATMPEKCVATRVLTVAEATRWRADGHPLIDILKPGVFAVSKFEQEKMEELHNSGLITHQIHNDGTIIGLHNKILMLLAESQLSTASITQVAVGHNNTSMSNIRVDVSGSIRGVKAMPFPKGYA
jgi:hypothetical protein